MDLLADSSADGVQALQDAEQRLQDFLHLASECFWELDESLRFRSHSGGGTTAPVEEFIGRTPWEVFGSDVDSAPWRDHVAVLLARKPFQNFEHQVFTPDGKTRWRAASGRPVFDREGRFRGYRGITTDITERKRADERLSLALDAGRAVVWEWDLATHRVMRSANAEHVYGVALSDASDFVDRIHPGDRDRHDALFEAAVAASTSYDVEFRFLRPDGGLRWFNTSARVRVERDGSKRVFGVTRDITPRKQAEGLAEGATACLRATLENMDQGLIMVDADETIRVYNRKVLDLLDLPEDLMHGSGSYTAVKRYQRERDEFARSDETRRLWFETGDFLTKTVQYERERPNGTVLEVRSTPIPGGGAVRTFTDITARRKAEIELRESEARFRNLADNAPVMVWVTEPDGSCSYLSRSWYQFTGQTPEGALGFGWLEAVHPEDRPAVEQAFHGGAPRRGPFQIEYRLRHRSGEYRWAIDAAAPRFGHDGTYLGYVGSVIDITQRKHTEEALSRSREELRAALEANRVLLEQSLDVICTVDETGAFVRVSPHAVTVWGYTPEELAGRRYIEFVHPEDRERSNAVAASIMQGTPTSAFENRFIRKDGSVVPILWSAVWSEEHRTIFCVARDLSERLRAEEQLRQSQKMEAVGQLTGGIAHDFNNLLTVVIGNTEILADNLADPGHRGLARMTLEAAEKGAELTRHLLAFGRRQSLKPEQLSLEEVVRGMAPLLRRTLGAPIELETTFGDASFLASADQTFLESAVLNLAVNAKDAMPQGGTLTITTGAREAGPGEGSLQPGQEVVFLTVSDTGHGMAPEVQEHAFEPFFTTKEVGKGSGLGLSMVWGFAQQSGGHVSISSRPGTGTAVTIVLPASGRKETVPSADATQAGMPAERRRRVLLVEDEPQVLQFVSTQLASLGYDAVAVSNGQDALDILMRDPAFDLLFTDVVLPKGLSGVELARRARELRPGLPVLLTSGYAEEAFEHYGRPDEGTPLLRKPYRRRELAEALRRAMDPESAQEPPCC